MKPNNRIKVKRGGGEGVDKQKNGEGGKIRTQTIWKKRKRSPFNQTIGGRAAKQEVQEKGKEHSKLTPSGNQKEVYSIKRCNGGNIWLKTTALFPNHKTKT